MKRSRKKNTEKKYSILQNPQLSVSGKILLKVKMLVSIYFALQYIHFFVYWKTQFQNLHLFMVPRRTFTKPCETIKLSSLQEPLLQRHWNSPTKQNLLHLCLDMTDWRHYAQGQMVLRDRNFPILQDSAHSVLTPFMGSFICCSALGAALGFCQCVLGWQLLSDSFGRMTSTLKAV